MHVPHAQSTPPPPAPSQDTELGTLLPTCKNNTEIRKLTETPHVVLLTRPLFSQKGGVHMENEAQAAQRHNTITLWRFALLPSFPQIDPVPRWDDMGGGGGSTRSMNKGQ